jgi:hypothetical protein
MFGNNYGLKIHSVIEKGTEVVIRLPMIDESQVAQYITGKEQIIDDDNH